MTTPDAPKTRMPFYEIVAFMALSSGLCTIFALVVTAAQAWQEHAQTQWPHATATVERCAMRRRSFGRPGYYYADCRFNFLVANQSVHAELASRYVATDQIWQFPRRNWYGQFEQWVDEHPPGTPVELRYDPAHPQMAVLIDTDTPFGGPHTPNNLKLLEAFAAGFFTLLLLVRMLRPQPADAQPFIKIYS